MPGRRQTCHKLEDEALFDHDTPLHRSITQAIYIAVIQSNSASVVVVSFAHAVSEFGLPSRACSDHGMENSLFALTKTVSFLWK